MPGTREGGKKAAQKVKEKHGDDFFKRIAKKSQESWVKNGRKPRGFSAMSPEERVKAGRKGGLISRRRAREQREESGEVPDTQ